MRDDCSILFRDEGKSATYRRIAGDGFDTDTGQETQTVTEYPIEVVPGSVTQRRADLEDSPVEIGDLVLRVRPGTSEGQLPVEPSDKDEVVYDGDTYDIVSWEGIGQGAVLRLYGRK